MKSVVLSSSRRWILSSILFLTFFAYAGASLFAYNRVTLPQRQFHTGTPQVPFLDVTFPARGQTYLVHAFYLSGTDGMPVLIDVHGYNESRRSPYHLNRTAALQSLGYTVLAIDLNDNGGDTVQNGRISMGYMERWDVLGGFDYLVSMGVAPGAIGIVSESMGAATSLLAASMEPRVRAVWADSPFEDASTVLGEQAARQNMPGFLMMGGMFWGVLIAGDRIWEVQPIRIAPALADHRQAIYLIATTGDRTVLYHHGTDLYKAYQDAGVNVQFWSVPDLEHVQTIVVDRKEYLERLKAFFDKTLS